MADITFVEGLHYEDSAVPGVNARIAVHAGKFGAFMEAHKSERGWVYIQLRESSAGNLYACLDTFRTEPEPHDKEMQDGVSYSSPIHEVIDYPSAPEAEIPF